MNQRHTPLQSWERAAFERYVRLNGFRISPDNAFWHAVGALLRGAGSSNLTPTHFSHAVMHGNTIMLIAPASKIEQRLYSLFAE